MGCFWVVLVLISLSSTFAENCQDGSNVDCCKRSLRPGQYYCTSPRIDLETQSEVGCTPKRLVNVSCFAAPNVSCHCNDTLVGITVDYNETQCIFQKEQPCRYVQGRRYDYRIAVALSLFLGMFGIDRFYLGYPAIGLLKLCTLGFFFIGHLIDFLLILVQVVGPADRSDYYSPFYGPQLTRIGLFTSSVNVTDLD